MTVLRLVKIQFPGNQRTLEVKLTYFKRGIGGKVTVIKNSVKTFGTDAWVELKSVPRQIDLHINGSSQPIFFSEDVSSHAPVPNGAVKKQATLKPVNPTHRDALLRPLLHYELISDPARIATLKRQARLLALADEISDQSVIEVV